MIVDFGGDADHVLPSVGFDLACAVGKLLGEPPTADFFHEPRESVGSGFDKEAGLTSIRSSDFDVLDPQKLSLASKDILEVGEQRSRRHEGGCLSLVENCSPPLFSIK